MIRLILLITYLALSASINAQPDKKPAAKEKAPTSKEMNDMMKEAEEMMKQMDPDAKRMMDSMGIKMPDMNQMQKKVSGVNDKQLAAAWEEEMAIVPKKDAKRISAIQTTPVNEASMSAYLQTVFGKITTVITPSSKQTAEGLYIQLKTEYTANDIGTIAMGLWLAGRNEIAVYLLSKACIEDPSNTDNLNNLAAMVLMNSGEHLAIPVLNYINKKFPRNSTVLNNLGQAWFGLGDIAKSEKYLDSTVRIYASHPQANFTKSLIEEEKGNKTEAVNLVRKSLEHSFSVDKLNRLEKLGEKMKEGDANPPPKTKADPLNLGGFQHPSFPKSVDECFVLKPEWDTYRESLGAEIEKLESQIKEALQIAEEKQEERVKKDFAMVAASINAGSPQGNLTVMPLFIHKAAPKLKDVIDDYSRKMEAWTKKATDFMYGKGMELKEAYQKEMARLMEEDGEQSGEGKPNKDYCPRYKETTNTFLRSYNTETEQLYLERIKIVKPYLNDMTYYSMYTNWPEMFEVIKLEAKKSWLRTLWADAPNNFEYNLDYVCNKKDEESKNSKLAEFDDVACQYHSEMNMVVFKIKTDCSRMTTELDTKFIKFGLKQDMDKKTFSDQFMNCNVEFRASIGEKVKLGPIEAGVKLTGGAGFEFDRTGLTDAYIIGGVSAKAGGIGGGTEGKYSLISGHGAFKGTGMFKGK